MSGFWALELSRPPSVSAQSTRELEQLVAKLGSPIWQHREQAQQELLERGLTVASHLREALDSPNREQAYRASQLLDHLDPRQAHFQILRVKLGEQPVVMSTAYASSTTGQSLLLQPRSVTKLNANRAEDEFEYVLLFNTSDFTNLQISVERSPRGYQSKTRLESPLATTRGISLLACSEEGSIQHIGNHVQRERTGFLTLLRVRYGRHSDVELAEITAADSDALLSQLIGELQVQAQSTSSSERRAALTILSYVARGRQLEAFTQALEDPALRRLGALGLDQTELLQEELLQPTEQALPSPSPVVDATTPTRSSPDPILRVAARLCERGIKSGAEFLVDRLTTAEPQQLHFAVASIADALHREDLTQEVKARACDTVLSRRFLTRALWEDAETEYLLAAVASVARMETESETAALREALTTLYKLVDGSIGETRLPLRKCMPVWNRLARRLPPPQPSPREFLFSLVPVLLDSESQSQANQLVEAAISRGGFTPREFERIVHVLSVPGSGRVGTRTRLFLRLLGSWQDHFEQLPAMVEGLLRLGQEITTSELAESQDDNPRQRDASQLRDEGRLREIVSRLEEFTEVTSGWNSESDTPPPWEIWAGWLDDESEIIRRQVTLRESHAPQSASPSFVLYEFELLLETQNTGIHNLEQRPSSFEVLDGRRLRLNLNESKQTQDRWGNPFERTVKNAVSGVRRSNVTFPTQQQSRFRLGPATPSLQTGLPTLSRVADRDVRLQRYETSVLFYGARPLPRRGGSSIRSAFLLLPSDEAPMPPAKAMADADSLWKWFIDTHVLQIADQPTAAQSHAVLQLVSSLRLEGDIDFLRASFARQPSTKLAHQLYHRGDSHGVDHYRRVLPALKGVQELDAAVFLAGVGESAAAHRLVDLFKKQHELMIGYRKQRAFTAFRSYFRSESVALEDKLPVLDVLVEEAQATTASSTYLNLIYQALEEESGTDFGYAAARGTNDPAERRSALQEAAAAAQRWLAELRP